MGTWGTGYFEDDFALDFMQDIEDSKDPKQKIKEALQTALTNDYLEGDDGTAVIVSATYIDAQLNGTRFGAETREEPLDVDTFSSRNPNVVFSDLKADAITALKKVISGNSELNELWEENDEDYPEWRAGVDKLISSLSK